MKKAFLFPAAALIGGIVAFILRFLQNRTGFDALGLPVPGNIPGMALIIVLILMAAVLLVLSRKLPVSGGSFPQAFMADTPTQLFLPVTGILLIALSGAADLYEGLTTNNLLVQIQLAADPYSSTIPEAATSAGFSSASQLVLGGSGLVTAAALFLSLLSCRKWILSASSAGTALLIPPVALVVRLVMTYRLVSINPALEAYYVELLSLIFLTLAFYRLSSFSFGDGHMPRFALYAGLAAVCALAALADGGPHLSSLLLYAGGMLTVLGFLLLRCLQPNHSSDNDFCSE
jgi:hypothetical protein